MRRERRQTRDGVSGALRGEPGTDREEDWRESVESEEVSVRALRLWERGVDANKVEIRAWSAGFKGGVDTWDVGDRAGKPISSRPSEAPRFEVHS
jgi:hypothetical protein